MELVSKEDFQELNNTKFPKCITIYLPVHQSGLEVNEKQDKLNFKNILQEVTYQLKEEHELNNAEINSILDPAYALLKDKVLWYDLAKGMGVFLAKGFIKIVHLPVMAPQEIHINSSFNLTPLIPLVINRKHFYLLNFSKDSTKFYKCDAFHIQEIEVKGLPESINDVIHFEEKSERKLFRGGGNAPGAKSNFHGHDNGLADEKEYILHYLKEVDQTLWIEVLANEQAPLVLAAVEFMAAMYKNNSRYEHITEGFINGNYEHAAPRMLLEKALEIVQPLFNERSNKALNNYYNNLTTDLTSSMPDKIIPASYYSQISDLFVEKGAHIWGRFDENTNKLVTHNEKQIDDECLINKAVLNTLMNGGDVHILEKEQMPKESTIAAFMRFNT